MEALKGWTSTMFVDIYDLSARVQICMETTSLYVPAKIVKKIEYFIGGCIPNFLFNPFAILIVPEFAFKKLTQLLVPLMKHGSDNA